MKKFRGILCVPFIWYKMVQKNSPDFVQNFFCEICDYKCCKHSDFTKHKNTLKHKLATNGTKMVPKTRQNSPHEEYFFCECGKKYKYKQGLYRHLKNCKLINKIVEKEDSNNIVNSDLKTMVVQLINHNSEMKNIIMKQQEQISELIPKIGHTTNNTTNKNKFNINLFLNEKCKDALSLDKFIERVEVSMKNLLTTRDKGSAEGISDIIIDNINKLSLYERPLHCTDVKRETLYIKNEDEWEKDKDKKVINNAIKKIENKQLKNIQIWLDEHPNWENNTKEQEEYMKIINNCTGSLQDTGGDDKIIRRICNELYVSNEII